MGECSFQLFGRDLARDCKVDFTDFSCVVRLAPKEDEAWPSVSIPISIDFTYK